MTTTNSSVKMIEHAVPHRSSKTNIDFTTNINHTSFCCFREKSDTKFIQCQKCHSKFHMTCHKIDSKKKKWTCHNCKINVKMKCNVCACSIEDFRLSRPKIYTCWAISIERMILYGYLSHHLNGVTTASFWKRIWVAWHPALGLLPFNKFF